MQRLLYAVVFCALLVFAYLPALAGEPAEIEDRPASSQVESLSPGDIIPEVSAQEAVEEYRRGREQFLAGRLEDALLSFRRASDLDPLLKEAYIGAGCAEDAKGNYSAATASYEMALGLDSKDVSALNNMGVSLFNSGKLEESGKAFQKALEISPSAGLYSNLGVVSQRLQSWDEAFASYQKAREFSPEDPTPLYNMAIGKAAQGRSEEALALGARLLAREPGNSGGHLLRGVFLFRLGKTREALDELHEAVRLDPDSSEANYDLGIALLFSGKSDEAQVAFQRAVELKTGFLEGHLALGQLFGDAGRYEEAQNEYFEALRLSPGRDEIQIGLGNLLLRQGKLGEAAQTYARVIQMNPKNAVAHNNLGVLLKRQERPDDAIREFQSATEADPAYATAWYNMGYLLEAKENRAGALKAFENVLRLAPGAAEAPEIRVKVQELRQ
ncbi:MAG: tetratricopeptide repeat protein [bacterium]